MFHASFPDFLRDRSRSKRHYLSAVKFHELLARCCLGEMRETLVKDNICGLENNEVSRASLDQSRIRECIPDALEYACFHWLSHVAASEDGLSSVEGRIVDFFDVNVLRWIERMTLLGKLGLAITLLRMLE